MAVTKADIAYNLLPGVKGIFFEAYDNAPAGGYERYATIINSNRDTEQYAWIGAVPKMREFIGERQVRDLKGYNHSIQNKTWEATIGVERSAAEDDQLNHVRYRVQTLAREARRHQDELCASALINAYTSVTGSATTCYDGQNLVSASHPGYSTQSNYGSTTTLSAAAVQAGMIAMQSLVDDQGKPWGIRPNLLIVGPALEFRAREIIQSSIVVAKVGEGTAGTGATASTPYKNVLEGAMDILVVPYLIGSAAYYWYLVDTTAAVRPVIFQVRTEPEFTALESQSEAGFMRDEFFYGVRARYAVGGGFWPAIRMYAATS